MGRRSKQGRKTVRGMGQATKGRLQMLQPETLKALGEGLKTAWASVGPLVGVIIGAMLTRAWDRRKWINENRKQEYRELLTTLTSACTVLIDNAQAIVQSPAEQIF